MNIMGVLYEISRFVCGTRSLTPPKLIATSIIQRGCVRVRVLGVMENKSLEGKVLIDPAFCGLRLL